MSKGLKINNAGSSIKTPEQINHSEAFKQAANEAAKRLEGFKNRSFELGLKFKNLLESNVLPENKTTILKDLEGEVLSQLSQLANEINNDEAQPEGTGSVALCQLMMKMMLIQRDNINSLKFQVEELKKEITSLKKI